jgi:hypothetical protein
MGNASIGIRIRKFAYFLFLSSPFVYSYLLSGHCGRSIGSTGICIDSYWLDHWLIDYGSGFTRRGLLGYIHTNIFGKHVNILALNIFCFFQIYIIFHSVYNALRHFIRIQLANGIFILIAASPIASVFFETIGDPIQLIISLLSLLLLVLLKIDNDKIISSLVLAFILLSALVHEGILFLIAPVFIIAACYPLKRGYWKRLKIFLLFILLISAIGLLITTLSPLNSLNGRPLTSTTITAFNPLDKHTYSFSGELNMTFMEVLKSSGKTYFFSGKKNFFFFLLKPLCTGLIPISILISLFFSVQSIMLKNLILKCWFSLVITSFPLYIIAVDWGRFSSYSIVVGILIIPLLLTRNREPLADFTYQPNNYNFLVLLVVGIIIQSAYPITSNYRIGGILIKNIIALLLTSLIGGIFLLLSRPKQANIDALRETIQRIRIWRIASALPRPSETVDKN